MEERKGGAEAFGGEAELSGSSWLVWGLLTVCGLAGNWFRYEIVFSIQFVFGSIFAMLALQLFGLFRGVLAAFLISLITYKFWNHPYAVIIMTAEVAFVGLLNRRRKMDHLMADALYWVFLGIPLVILFYYGVMRLPFYNVVVTMMKQAVNGIANVMAARLLFMVYSYRIKRERFSMKEIIFSLLTLFMLLPLLLTLALESHSDRAEVEQRVRESLHINSAKTVSAIETWLQTNLRTVEQVAWLAATQPLPVMQRTIEQFQNSSRVYYRMGLLDESATIIAYSPLRDEQGGANIGKNFADRPYIPVLRETLKPMVSEVVFGRLGKPRPIVNALAPVVRKGAYAGYAVGVLDLTLLRELLQRYTPSVSLPELQFVLLDRNGRVIVSSRTELNTLDYYERQGGLLTRLDGGILQWVPESARNVSVSERWKKAFYVDEHRLGGPAEWTLVLEQPLAPFQKQL